jgi:DNA-binding CsgD family transcriptional regulator
MQLHGAWPDALDEARRAGELLSQGADQTHAAGSAFYQQAELYRLQGEFNKAEEAYRLAARWGRSPQPGLALLRLARDDVSAAVASIQLLAEETRDPVDRSRVLPAVIEIMLAAGDVVAAQRGADELAEVAAVVGAPLLQAASNQATGAVLLAEGDARAALTELRRAWSSWQELDAPYEAARVRVLIGIACRQLGDGDTAEVEFDAARWAFEQLGAAPDLSRVEAILPRAAKTKADGLTSREVDVLRLVAAGKTNRAIAADLFVSEHTVRRHLQNIFTKVGVSSRAAATAFAYQHNLT